MSTCPTEETWLAWVEGEQSEVLRAHLMTCTPCSTLVAELQALTQSLGASMPYADPERAVTSVMQQVRASQAVEKRRVRVRLVGVALAATLACVIVGTRLFDSEGVSARGGQGAPGLRRATGVSLRLVAAPETALADGAALAADDALVMTTRTIDLETDAFLLCFAVDSVGTIHWLYPSHETLSSNEASVLLPKHLTEVALSESIILDRPALGPLTVFSVLTATPLSVQDIEGQPVETMSVEQLEHRWPSAVVSALSLKVMSRAP